MSEGKKQPLNDVSKMLNTAMSGITGMFGDVKSQLNEKIDCYLAKLDLVKREEFDLLKAMLSESRKEQKALSKRLDALEEKPKKKKSA